jgi:hypothetical protein
MTTIPTLNSAVGADEDRCENAMLTLAAGPESQYDMGEVYFIGNSTTLIRFTRRRGQVNRADAHDRDDTPYVEASQRNDVIPTQSRGVLLQSGYLDVERYWRVPGE